MLEKKEDVTLLSKLREERSGILSWLVRGCIDYLNNGLNPPKIVLNATKAYKQNEDIIGQFLDYACNIDNTNQTTISTSKLFENYKFWHLKYISNKVMSQKTFGLNMVKKGFEKLKNSTIFWLGITIKQEFEDEKLNDNN
jgi:putative DNA primase/helicase